ncbi:MBL fold metallo-hydrolase [Synechococcus moorigangaii CMS01]|nr:MBL fold metallo-hydrolase [Synechococcus moorigangaii CMS01]
MKRRQFIQTAGISAFGAIAGVSLLQKNTVQAQTSGLDIEWFGHTCFTVSGGGTKILINPFQALSCTAGYRTNFPQANVVLLSSQLFDEGYTAELPGTPRILFQAGQYPVNNLTFDGIRLDHANIERYQGWRFPPNIAWSWRQSGLSVLHLGGAGEEVDIDDFILTGGSPDILMIPVGGNDADPKNISPKGYTPAQAVQVLELLRPKLIIPTHYKTAAGDATCGLQSIEEFLNLVDRNAMKVTNVASNRLQVSPGTLSQEMPEIRVLSDRPRLKA